MSRGQVARFLRHFWWGLAGSGPYSDGARGQRDARRPAAAKAYDNCADRMERWIEWNAARGKPDWSEFHAILNGWRTSAEYLRGDRQHRPGEQ